MLFQYLLEQEPFFHSLHDTYVIIVFMLQGEFWNYINILKSSRVFIENAFYLLTSLGRTYLFSKLILPVKE